jgi:hypothetical protein
MKLNNITLLTAVLFIASISTESYCFDICGEGAKGLTETTAVFSDNFNTYIKDHNASGYGILYDIHATANSCEFVVVIECGNDVILVTRSRSGGLSDLKIGTKVHYSGNIEGWRKHFYPGTNRRYIQYTVGISNIDF